MQLVTFERMLIDRLNATGQVEARSFNDIGVKWLYGIAVNLKGTVVPFRLTKGSGTGDPKPTEDEQAAHDAYVARAGSARQEPSGRGADLAAGEVSKLMQAVLVADLPPAAVAVEGPTESTVPGVKIRFDTDAEIFVRPIL